MTNMNLGLFECLSKVWSPWCKAGQGMPSPALFLVEMCVCVCVCVCACVCVHFTDKQQIFVICILTFNQHTCPHVLKRTQASHFVMIFSSN